MSTVFLCKIDILVRIVYLKSVHNENVRVIKKGVWG